MPEVPSIKGVGFLGAWERVTALLEEGRISRDELEARLEKEDLAILDERPEPSLWYPIASVSRLDRVLVELDGAGRPQYHKEAGRRAAESLLRRASIKHLFDVAVQHGDRAGHSLIGMASLVYSFGRWNFEGDLREFTIELSEAEAFPELSPWAVSGFAEALFQRVSGRGFEVTFTRPLPDLVIFRGQQL